MTQILRTSQLLRLLELLDETVLSRSSFAVEKEDNTTLIIAHKEFPEFRFEVALEYAGESFDITAQPGLQTATAEEHGDVDFDELVVVFIEWSNRVVEDVLAFAAMQVSGGTQSFQECLNKHILALKNPSAVFSEKEAEEWIGKIDATVEQLCQLREELNVTKEDCECLKQDIEGLKALVRSMPKGAWVRAAGGRIAAFLERAATIAIGAATEGAVKALLGLPRGS